jgi:hypothetical protein
VLRFPENATSSAKADCAHAIDRGKRGKILRIASLIKITLLLATVFILPNHAFGQEAQQETELVISQSNSASVAKSKSVLGLKWNPYSKPANSATPSAPQDDSNGWHFESAPYLWAAALKGDLRVRNTTTQVDASFSDLFEQLDFAIATQFEAIKGRWRLILDENYMNLGTTGSGPLGRRTVGVEPTLNFFEFGGSYELVSVPNKEATADKPLPPVFSMEIGGGGRYTHFGLGLEPQNAAPVEASRNLVDAFFSNRFKFRPHPAVTLIGKYTVGGGGSHDAETVTGLVDLRFRKNMSVWFGYQYMHMDADQSDNVIGFNGSMRGLILGATLRK